MEQHWLIRDLKCIMLVHSIRVFYLRVVTFQGHVMYADHK
jgi:hypothetical protein